MNEHESKIHRTWTEYLVNQNLIELAAAAVESQIAFRAYYCDEQLCYVAEIRVDVPLQFFDFVNSKFNLVERTLIRVCDGHIYNDYADAVEPEKFKVTLKIALREVEEGWENIVKRLIFDAQDSNQGLITEKVFGKRNQRPLAYNEMKFASQSEIRIAQALENQKILFFPLPLAVRHETGNYYKDHREVDFLVCVDGTWGILEVAFHPDRYEKDKEKDAWFKKSGILCIEHYSAEKCYQSPDLVVSEFLETLAKYKRS